MSNNTKHFLAPGESLAVGESLLSQDGRFRLILQSDGNLVIYQDSSGDPLWASGTDGERSTKAVIQAEDGDFVLYAGTDPVWASKSAHSPGAYLTLQNDGNAVISTAPDSIEASMVTLEDFGKQALDTVSGSTGKGAKKSSAELPHVIWSTNITKPG